MSYAETMTAIRGRRAEIVALRGQLRELQASVEPQEVEDYEFAGWDGPVRLSDLFGDKRDLFVIHNMGTACAHCTMWADGFNGVYDHLADRAAFVVSSPNPTEMQRAFAASRGWRFPMISHQGGRFAKDMGYWRAKEGGGDLWHPGVSAFRQDKGRIVRVSDAELGPGDDFCSVGHFFNLLPEGPDGWSAKLRYG